MHARWVSLGIGFLAFQAMAGFVPAIQTDDDGYQIAQNRGQIFRAEENPDLEPPPPPRKRPVVAPPSAWPAGLNSYFKSDLTNPTPDQVMAVLVHHLNQRTLFGTDPEEEYERFSDWLKKFRKTLPKDEVETEPVDGFYRNLTRWVALEAGFTRKPERSTLKDLVKLVEDEAERDPGLDADRKERIIATIKDQSLFVPSGILFGFSVLPYRPVTIPRGFGLYEVLGAPEFDDAPGRARVLYDFLQCPGPLLRIDFDTVATTQFRVEIGDDLDDLKPIAEFQSASPEGFRPPAILQAPSRGRYLRLTAESSRDMAILRNPLVFALKEPCAAICPAAGVPPVLDGSFREGGWPETPQIDGFVIPDGPAFAEAQTTVRLCRTSDTLYAGVYAREPRMSTMVAEMAARDADLFTEESIELAIEPAGQPVYRFIVNPIGARFDSRDGQVRWDGDWQVVTKSYPTGWVAEFAIPFSTLGGPPKAGRDWLVNCLRTRRNVQNERSVWAYTEKSGENASGSLIFD